VTVQDNPFLARYADKFKIFIFHRVLYTPSAAKLIDQIKKREKEIIFETDDLVFDPKYLTYMDYYRQMNVFEKKLYENGVGGEILNDPYVKVCTTTTAYLAEKLSEYGKQVFIVPNKLSNSDLEIADKIVSKQSSITDDKIRIGYFSGTISHNKDFATITDTLMEIMEKFSQVELFLAGPLDIENKLNKFRGRIKQLPYVPREKHFENIALVDINIVPLEIGNPFCEAKSELKFFEAGILGVPTVASAMQTFKEAIDDGIDGLIAATKDEWVLKLEKLIDSVDLRKKIGEAVYRKSIENYTNINSKNTEFYDYLNSKLK
jgi:glycosyltransferase involved in cell wall biosynthesis